LIDVSAFLTVIKFVIFFSIYTRQVLIKGVISSTKWSPSLVGTVSFDASIFFASNRMDSGVVIRDHNSACLATCREHFEGITSSELAEAMADRQTICFAKSDGFEKVFV
jgi:hypothetical protein